ncbi:MAG: PAS domain-containing sensor histidine kinase [Limisphaerales bacterium]
MKAARRQRATRPAPSDEVAELRARLADAEETLRAIGAGDVDALVVTGKQGREVYTLQSADHAYRVLVEAMNEGAVTLMPDGMILYANQCFARTLARPLEEVIGSSFQRFLSAADQAILVPLLEGVDDGGARIELVLQTGAGVGVPARVSIRALAQDSFKHTALCLVVTDMTEARRNEERLRDLTHRLMQAQEAERGRVANDLRVNITQLLYVILGCCQTLAKKLPSGDNSLSRETARINEVLNRTVEEVHLIWRSLWSNVLERQGLVPALQAAGTEFAERTGVSLQMECAEFTAQLPAEAALALYRIFQETLSNVEKHARARHVAVRLTQQPAFIELAVKDDGIGFEPDHSPAGQKKPRGLGLVGMSERAAGMGGALSVKSAPRAGTGIQVRIPRLPRPGN